MENNTPLFALVGMPGSGKSETAKYFKSLGFSLVRFGEFTDKGLSEKGLPTTEENERVYREEIRKLHGMQAYAVLAEPRISTLQKEGRSIIIDGLYSWEEYKFLISKLPNLKIIHIYTEPQKRYKRLSARKIRPLTRDQARKRDVSEIENLQKGGPIAIADYLIDNNSSVGNLYKEIDSLLKRTKSHA